MQKTKFQIPNEQAQGFEEAMDELGLSGCIRSIREGDFWTTVTTETDGDDELQLVQTTVDELQ